MPGILSQPVEATPSLEPGILELLRELKDLVAAIGDRTVTNPSYEEATDAIRQLSAAATQLSENHCHPGPDSRDLFNAHRAGTYQGAQHCSGRSPAMVSTWKREHKNHETQFPGRRSSARLQQVPGA